LKDDLRPLSDLKAHASEVVRQADETGRPIVITRHGRGIAVLLSIEAFEDLQAEARRADLQAGVEAAERAYAAGEWTDGPQVDAELRAFERNG
jgi:prevent-host-death family protein